MCGNRPHKEGKHWHEDVYRCRKCGCVFELDTEEFLESDGPIFWSPFLFIEEGGSRDGFDRVLLWLKEEHPEWKGYLDDPGFSGFLRDFYAYNHWLNRGNEPSFEELVEDGGFETDVRCVLGKTDSLDIWFGIQFDETPQDELEEVDSLYRRFTELRKRYANNLENRNRRRKGWLRH